MIYKYTALGGTGNEVTRVEPEIQSETDCSGQTLQWRLWDVFKTLGVSVLKYFKV